MHDWLGFGLIILGLALGTAGIIKRRARNRRSVAAGDIRPEFAAMGEIVRPLVLFAVGFIAFKMSLFYFVFGGNSMMTPLEYAALMFVFAAYCGYLVAATARPARATQPAPSVAGSSDPSAVGSTT